MRIIQCLLYYHKTTQNNKTTEKVISLLKRISGAAIFLFWELLGDRKIKKIFVCYWKHRSDPLEIRRFRIGTSELEVPISFDECSLHTTQTSHSIAVTMKRMLKTMMRMMMNMKSITMHMKPCHNMKNMIMRNHNKQVHSCNLTSRMQSYHHKCDITCS